MDRCYVLDNPLLVLKTVALRAYGYWYSFLQNFT